MVISVFRGSIPDDVLYERVTQSDTSYTRCHAVNRDLTLQPISLGATRELQGYGGPLVSSYHRQCVFPNQTPAELLRPM